MRRPPPGPAPPSGAETPPDAGTGPVLVVGAGPAGSSLALRLARRNVPVRLLDARAFPRSKPCGDCLSPGAGPLLRELGLVEEIRRRRPARLRGWRIRTPSGRWFGQDFSPHRGNGPAFGYSLPREELDSLLLDAAVEAGAEFLPRRRVFRLLREDGRIRGVVARDGDGGERRYRGSLVVGADGLRSVVARRAAGVDRGSRRRLALVGRFAGGRGADGDRRGELRLDREGVTAVAPTGRGRLNVTVVVPADRAPEISRDRESAFQARVRRAGLSGLLSRTCRTGPLEITGPFEATPRTVAMPGLLLVGDAAGYFDPLTGQGIYRALATARLASRYAAALLGPLPGGTAERHESRERSLSEAGLLRRYARELRGILEPGRRVQRAVDAAVSRPLAIEAAGALLAARPGLAGLLLEVTGDRLPASSLVRPDRLLAAAGRFTWTQSAPASTM